MDVIFYEKRNGEVPALDFIESLQPKAQESIFKAIDTLGKKGNNISNKLSKPLKDGIFELRIPQDGNTYRVLYFFYVGNKAIITNGFKKKTRKAPTKEIERAIAYRKDWVSSHVDFQ